MLSTISKITKKNKMLKKSRKHIIIKRKKHNFQPHTTLTFLTFIKLSRNYSGRFVVLPHARLPSLQPTRVNRSFTKYEAVYNVSMLGLSCASGFIETLGQKENGKRNKSSSVSVWFSVLHTAFYISFRCFKIEKYVVSFSLSLNFFNLFKWHIDCALNNAVHLGTKIQYRFT